MRSFILALFAIAGMTVSASATVCETRCTNWYGEQHCSTWCHH